MPKSTCPKCGRYCYAVGELIEGQIIMLVFQCLECLVVVHDRDPSVPPEERLPAIEISLTFTVDFETGEKIVAGDPFSAS